MLPTLTANEQAELMSALAKGERRAFERLYQLFFRSLSGYLLRHVRDASLAEELVDDTMFEAWKHASRFRGDSKLSTWLFGIARHRALNALRSRPPVADDIEDHAVFADSGIGPEAQASRHEAARALDRALSVLACEQREALELVLHQGLSYEEAAQVMATPVNTVKTRVFHARRKLREWINSQHPELVNER